MTFSVGEKTLIRDINITVNQSQLYAIVGPNGAGKSTLLHCLSGLHPGLPVQYEGRGIDSLNELDMARFRAVLPQNTALGFPFPVKEVVKMSFALHSISQEEQNSLAALCMEQSAVTHLANRNYLSLSGGEQQRVQLARVYAQMHCMEPDGRLKFLFLDEPTAPLDLKHQFQLFEHLKQLPKAMNAAVLIVIHDLDMAAAYCDELWLMNQGRIVAQGSPEQVLSRQQLAQHFDVNLSVHMTNHIPQLDKLSYHETHR